MEVVINLASERIYAYSNRNGVIERIKNGNREYFDTFVQFDENNEHNPLKIPNSTKYYNNSLLYALNHICSDANDLLHQKTKSIHSIPMITSSDGLLEYQTSYGSISPKEIISYILKDIIIKVHEHIKQLIVIIPDSYDQPHRCTLRDIIMSLFTYPVELRFLNHSTAGIACFYKNLPSDFQRKALVIRFDSAGFEVSVFKDVTSFSATPVCCISDPTIGGVDIITQAYSLFLHKLASAKNLDENDQKPYFQYNWMGIKNFIGLEDIDDNIPSFYYTVNHQKKETDYDPEFTFKAAQQCQSHLLHTIQLCLELSGFNHSDIAFVFSTGMWSSTIGVKQLVRELFPSAVLKEMDDDALCKITSTLFHNNQRSGFKQCLQTCWSMQSEDMRYLLLDRFISYPYSNSTVLNLPTNQENQDQILLLNMISMDNKSSVIAKHTIPKKCYEDCLTVRVDITIDQLGIVSDAVYCYMNKKEVN